MDGQQPNPGTPTGHKEFTNDESVSLRGFPAVPEPSASLPEVPDAPSIAPEPVAATPTDVSAAAQAAQEPDEQPQAPQPPVPTGFATPAQPIQTTDDELSWTASEFVAHPKTFRWYGLLAAGTIVLMLVAYLISHDIITQIVIVICAVLFGFTAARQPREMSYHVGANGIYIGPKFYPFSDFRSFAVIDEGAFSSVDFMPLKRFAPMLSVYYDPEHETHLLDILSRHLPLGDHQRGMTDNLMHRIRF